jgi:hypothetical protein
MAKIFWRLLTAEESLPWVIGRNLQRGSIIADDTESIVLRFKAKKRGFAYKKCAAKILT